MASFGLVDSANQIHQATVHGLDTGIPDGMTVFGFG